MRGTGGLLKRFLSLIGPKLVTTVLAIASTPIIVRLLGPGGYGNYAVVLSLYALYMIPISSAITEGVQKFLAEERNSQAWTERVLQFYFVLGLALALAGSTALLVVTGLGLASVFGDGFSRYVYVLAGFVVVGQFRGFTMHALLGFSLERINGPLNAVKKAVTVVVGITLVLTGLGVVGMLVGHIVANVVVAVVAGTVVLRRVSVPRLLEIPRSVPYREFLSFNGLNIVLVVLVMSLFHVDVIMLRTLVGRETTGYYKAALSLAEYLWLVPMVLQTMLLHSTSGLWSDGATDRITALAGRVTRYTALLVLLLAIGLGTLADRVVPLYYGTPFAVATTPLLLLLPGAVGFAVARPLQAICQGSGRLKVLILAVGVAAVGNLLLNAALIPRYGMNGAAVATTISYGSMFVLLVGASWRIGYDPLTDFRPVRIGLTAIGTALVTVGVDSVIASDVVALLVVPGVGLVAFAVAALLTGAIDLEETVEILEQLPLPWDIRAATERFR